MSNVYIEKEAAIRNICKGCGLFDTDNCICTGKVRCSEYDAILDTPSANVKPMVMGEWIIKPHKMMIKAPCCSVCGAFEPMERKYCPNCGADMRGESPR